MQADSRRRTSRRLQMDVVTLGTGSPIPDPNRGGSADPRAGRGATVLVDCGRAVVMRLAGAGVMPPMLDRVLLTHLHSDHITDLNDVITTRWVMSPVDAAAGHRPAGHAALVERTLAMLDRRRAVPARPPRRPDLAADVRRDRGDRRRRRRRRRDPGGRRADRPQAGAPDGRVPLRGGGQGGRAGGRHLPCEGLDRLCAGADVYVQTVVRPDLVRAVPSPRFQDILDYHSSRERRGPHRGRGQA